MTSGRPPLKLKDGEKDSTIYTEQFSCSFLLKPSCSLKPIRNGNKFGTQAVKLLSFVDPSVFN